MSRNKSVNLEVVAREDKSAEYMIREFIKRCKKSKLLEEIKDKFWGCSFFEKKSDIKRRKKNASAKRSRNRELENLDG